MDYSSKKYNSIFLNALNTPGRSLFIIVFLSGTYFLTLWSNTTFFFITMHPFNRSVFWFPRSILILVWFIFIASRNSFEPPHSKKKQDWNSDTQQIFHVLILYLTDLDGTYFMSNLLITYNGHHRWSWRLNLAKKMGFFLCRCVT